MALGYATDNRGGDNLRPFASMAECFGFRSKELGMPESFDPLSEAGKARWMIPCQNYFAAVNSLVVCMFTVIAFTVEPGQYARHLSALTGFNFEHGTGCVRRVSVRGTCSGRSTPGRASPVRTTGFRDA